MTTSRKIIKSWNARTIASRVASKAFAHLTSGLMEDRKQRMEALLLRQMEMHGLTYDLIANVNRLQQHSCEAIQCYVRLGRGDSVLIGIESEAWSAMPEVDRAAVRRFPMSYATISDEDLIKEFHDGDTAYQAVQSQRDKLEQELVSQLWEKPANTACKAWPEAADIICNVLGLPCDGSVVNKPMVTPLAQLLAKFMPALPAPVATQEEVAA